MDRTRLVYGLVMKMDMDMGAMISSQISHIAQSNSSRLSFPALITTLCEARGVVSDSLTFEFLSSTINLAYIRKNCWNPVDPSITFPGSLKATTRAPVEAPPVAPPPPKSLASSFSSTPPDQLVPMLQSIHHGQCVVIQSIHHFSEQQPVISLQDFLEQVAWPTIQTSLVGVGGDAPEA